MTFPEAPSEKKTKSSSGPLQFKPLTEGLGFHLFADGLPYAPRSTSSQAPQTGTGAQAAGKPVFAYPETRKEPLPRELQEMRNALKESRAPVSPRIPGPAPVRIQETSRPAPIRAQLAELESFGIGYALKRFFAYTIDLLFAGSLCLAVLSIGLLNVHAEDVGYVSLKALMTAGAFLLACIWSAIAAQEVAFGTSIGKRIFNLHLRGSGTEVFLRALFFIPSVLFSGLGILMCLADSKKRCWHDRVTQIQPEPM